MRYPMSWRLRMHANWVVVQHVILARLWCRVVGHRMGQATDAFTGAPANLWSCGRCWLVDLSRYQNARSVVLPEEK